jgi:hypothetical protein
MIVAITVAAVTHDQLEHLPTGHGDIHGDRGDPPARTEVEVRTLPSRMTLKVTVPALPTSSSTPTVAVKRVHFPPR